VKIKDNIAEEFNEFSKNYTADMVGCVPYYLELMSCFTGDLPKDFKPRKILDLGCGNGNVTHRLIQKFPDAEYTLVDASQEMISLCQKEFKLYNLNCIQCYFNEFYFQEDNYDLVVAGFSLHHCNSVEKQELFKKIYGSLKKGGFFACSDLMLSKSNPKHSKLKEQWKSFVHLTFPDGEKWKWLMEHYSEFDKPDNFSDQKSWLKDAGFTKIIYSSFEDYWVHFQAIKK
jgi:ubiquinone/menaquinone biosynthesis C-methylase UbiE